MGVSYEKYRIKLVKHKINQYDIRKATKLGSGTLTKLNKDEFVNLSSLDTIVKYFREAHNDNCDYKDLIEYIPD